MDWLWKGLAALPGRYKEHLADTYEQIKADPSGYFAQAAMEGLPPMPDIGQNPDGTIRRNPDDPAIKWLADNVGFGALTVYHGSPHKFGKFDINKLSTGDGMQAQGHGVYLAENPKVAASYGNPEKGGNLYKADIPDDMLGKVMDWDAPLSADSTPQGVRDALNKLVLENPEIKDDFYQAFRDGKPGWWYYSKLSDMAKTGTFEGNQAYASKKMREAGISGLKYLDDGSRAAGEGTRNYVLFDDQLPRILERNGVPTGAQPWQPGEYEAMIQALQK
jgi:hypothetical protein